MATKATAVYKNVQVLTDLSVDQFNRVMLGFAAWVAPADQSCAYCHNTEQLADDHLYTKRVARRDAEDDAPHQQGVASPCRVIRRHLLHLPSRQPVPS